MESRSWRISKNRAMNNFHMLSPETSPTSSCTSLWLGGCSPLHVPHLPLMKSIFFWEKASKQYQNKFIQKYIRYSLILNPSNSATKISATKSSQWSMTVDQSALLLDEKWTKTYFKIFSESLMGDSVIWIPFMSFLSSNTKKTPKCDHLSGISDREINSTTSGLGSWS